MDVLKHIEGLRLERGWSSYKLAEMSGLTGSTLTNMFSRKTMPSLTTLYALCEAFDITISEFFQTIETEEHTTGEITMLKNFRELYFERKKLIKEIIKEFLANNDSK